ncbi:MAG: hypothetical protein JSS20_01900 [Proteobacteria bacterium]|nr:hypothetical protein [Pseudomonadota bacterium]
MDEPKEKPPRGASRIVIRRNDRVVVVTGWKARIVGVLALMLVWLALCLLVVILFGIAITATTIFLLILPAAILAAIVQTLLNRRSG